MRISCIFILFLFSPGLNAQFNPSIVNDLRKKLSSLPDSAKAKIYHKLFAEFYIHSAFDSATTISLEAINFAKQSSDLKLESTALTWQGMVEFEKGNYEKTLTLYVEAIKIKENIHDEKGESTLLLNMAAIYYDRNNLDKAIEIYKKALELKKKLNDKSGQGIIYSNLGNIASNRGKYEEALTYYQVGLNLALEMKDTVQIAVADRTIANVYLSLKKVNEAEQMALNAYDILKRYNDRHYTQCLTLLGKIYLEKKEYPKSIGFLQKAYENSSKNETPFLTKEVCLVLVRVYEKINQFDKSLVYQKQYSQINDSIQNAQMGARLADMQIKYETEKKEKRIEHLQNEQAHHELEMTKKQEHIIILSGVFLTVFALLLALYFYTNVKKEKLLSFKQQEVNSIRQQKQKEIIQAIITTEEKERKKIASDLHDGLGQILTAAKITLVNLNGSSNQSVDKLKQVAELINSAIQESKAMALNLMPLTLKENGLSESIRNICLKHNKPGSQEISFKTYNLPEKLEPMVEINTYRICQELINNAIKYSQAASIFMQLFCRDNKLIIQIEDNGIGFDKEKVKKDSLGMNTLKDRVALLHGEIEIDSIPQKGTNIFIELSLS